MTQTEPAIDKKSNGVVSPHMKLEVVVLPVSDVDRAKSFYQQLGWRFDGDYSTGNAFRVVQFTPPGSACSVIFGDDVTSAQPGSTDGLTLVVDDVEAVRAGLLARGICVSEVFHDKGGIFHHAGSRSRVTGLDPEGRSYGSFASFSDADGNVWFLQEIRQRLPGR